ATNPGVFFRQRAWILVVIACTVVSVMIGLLLWPKSEDAGEDEKDPVALNRVDPRLDYRGPFLNVTARVKYVGSAACAECHPKQAGTYAEHPMGKSVLPVADFAATQNYGRKWNNPFLVNDVLFLVERRADRVWHRRERRDSKGVPIYQQDFEVHYLIGSGQRGHSYLCVRDEFVIQTPISWYREKKIWDKSPRFAESFMAGRPVT